MKSKFKKTVSAVSALVITVSAFSGFALSASAASFSADYTSWTTGSGTDGCAAVNGGTVEAVDGGIKLSGGNSGTGMEKNFGGEAVGTVTGTIVWDNTVKSYSFNEKSQETPSTPSTPSEVSSRTEIAAADARWTFGEFTHSNGVIGADKGSFAVSYAGKSFFKDPAVEGYPQSITIPFTKLPGAGREIKLYTGIDIPENLTNGIVAKVGPYINDVYGSAIEYLKSGDNERTYVDIDSKTPFATLTFSTKDNKTQVAITTLDETVAAADVTDNKVVIPVGATTGTAIKDATDLLVYVAGTEKTGDGKDITAGSFNTMTADFPVQEDVSVSMNPTVTNGYLGKMNTENLKNIDVKFTAKADGNIKLYGVKSYGAAPTDADLIGTVAVKKSDTSKSIAVTPATDKQFIYAVCDKDIAVTNATAKYVFEPGTNATDKLAQLKAEYYILNKQIEYQYADLTKLQKADVDAAVSAVEAYAADDVTKVVTDKYTNEVSYIKQTAEGLGVRDSCANVLSTIGTPAAENEYSTLMTNREALNNAYSEYKKLLVAGMRCVTNINDITAAIDKLTSYDNAAAAEYKAAVDAANAVTGLTKTVDGAVVFDEALVNGGNDFETKANAITALNTLANKFAGTYYDATAKSVITAAAGDIATINSNVNSKIARYKTDTASAFKSTFVKVEKAFNAEGADFAAQSAALKIDNIDVVFGLISKDTALIASINDPDGVYTTYSNYSTQLLAYDTAQEFLTALETLKQHIIDANGVNEDTYETLAVELNQVNALYTKYNALTGNGISNIDKETAEKVAEQAYYIEDAKGLLDAAAVSITAAAKTAIDTARNATGNNVDTAKKIKDAEFYYNSLRTQAKAYLDSQIVEDETTYADAMKAILETAKTYVEENVAAIDKLVEDNDAGYKEFVANLNYETVVTEVKDSEGKVTGHTNADYETYVTTYKNAVAAYDEINSYINGTTSWDSKNNKVQYNKADSSAVCKDVYAAFNIESKLSTIFNFRSVIYANNDNNAMTLVEDRTKALIDLIYADGTTYDQIGDDTAAIEEKVKAAYEANRIDYKSTVGDLAEEHVGTGSDVINAFLAEYNGYNAAYPAYVNMFETSEDAVKYENNETDTAMLAAGKLVYDVTTEFLAAEKAAAESVENDIIAKNKAAQEEIADITNIVNELDNAATVAGYSNSSDVSGAQATLNDVKARIETGKADEDKNFTDVEGTNHFVIPAVVESQIVTIETALNYWSVATTLYEDMVAGIEAADLKNGQYEAYNKAMDSYSTAAEQQKVYFNNVAKNNDNENIISDMKAKIDLYSAVNTNIKDALNAIPELTNVTQYNSYKGAFETIKNYIAAWDAEGATDSQKAEKELYNSDEYADVRADYDATAAKLAVIAPAAEFDAKVTEAASAQNDDDKYAKVKEAIDIHNGIMSDSPESLNYLGSAITETYRGLVSLYRGRLASDFDTAYAAVTKGSLASPVTVTDEWKAAIAAALEAYDYMYIDDQKAAEDKKAELEGLEAKNAEYATDKAALEALNKKVTDAVAAFEKDKDNDKANSVIDEVEAGYKALADKYTEEVANTVFGKSAFDAFKEAVNGNEEKEAALAAYNEAVSKLDINNITIDSYKDIAAAKDAYNKAVAAGALDESTGYGLIDACADKFNELPEVKQADADAAAVRGMIDALPAVDAGSDTIKDAAEDINKAKAAYDKLNEYGKTLVAEEKAEKLSALLEVLVDSPYDFDKDGVVNIFDLNRAVLSALGKQVYVLDKEGNDTEVTVLSILDTNEDGEVSLVELRAVVNAFTD